jgi:hypothetical protein
MNVQLLKKLSQCLVIFNWLEYWAPKWLCNKLKILRRVLSLGQNWNFPDQKMTNKLSRKLQELLSISWLKNDWKTWSFISIWCSVKFQLCKTLSCTQSLMKMFYFSSKKIIDFLDKLSAKKGQISFEYSWDILCPNMRRQLNILM